VQGVGKRRRRKRYEAIGGPICGQKFPLTDDGWLGIEHCDDETEQHWYRLCVVEDSCGKRARFWHYLGRRPISGPPYLFPAKRHFK
jgi:hypothetical protein